MAFQLSPGVNVTEIDLTTVVPAVATSDGAIAGVFRWGPVGQRILVDSETLLAKRFGKPTSFNAETYFTASSFLSYTNRLWVSRGANTSGPTPDFSVDAAEGNNVFVISGDVSDSIETGMYVTYSENTEVIDYGNEITVENVTVNGSNTNVTLSKTAKTSNSVNLYFGYLGTAYSAIATESGAQIANFSGQIVKNQNEYAGMDGSFDSDVLYVSKYPGALGNSLKISVCDNAESFNSNLALVANSSNYPDDFSTTFGNSTIQFSTSIGNDIGYIASTPGAGGGLSQANAFGIQITSSIQVGDLLKVGNASIGTQLLKVKTISDGVSNGSAIIFTVSFEDPYRLHTAYSTSTVISRNWEFYNTVDVAPGQSDYVRSYGNTAAQDELHVVVVDKGGKFTGTPGTIVEVYKNVSRASDAKNNDGSANFYKDVINQNSAYVWFANDRGNAGSNTAINLESSTEMAPGNYSFQFGNDGSSESDSTSFSSIASAYDLFVSPEDIDISLVLQGRPIGGSAMVNGTTVENFQLANYIIDNICEVRKDCIALISPDKTLTLNSFGTEATNLIAWRGALRSTSYAVLDSGYKWMYDKYNDVDRWIPMNGDVAGLCARTDQTNDAWWSPAGFNRGQIKNVIKLAYNPRKSERDVLYSNGVNPVVAFPGQGTVLYGDKTLQAKPSAFDHINVRRLFIVLEKAIATASKYSLFEFNDAFTRSQFKNLVTPYLRTIKGRRGITDFFVVCDDTNNTAQIVDTNQFVGDIYIKPARSINFIQLNFVAVGTGVQFSEVVGKF
jgi:hypothetical protein